MFVDTARIPENSTVQGDVCIIGAGAAGIALALHLVDQPIQVALLESGGLVAEANAPRIYQVLPGARPRLARAPSRSWYFGGNTNHWAGNCCPLDDIDFEPREWIEFSGWPIRKEHLLPYYERAQAVCGLGDLSWYDLDACRPHLLQQPLDVDPAVLTSKVVHTCPVPSFADLYRRRFETAENVHVYVHGTALRLKTNPAADQVHAVEVAGADGRRVRVEAKVFVLAAGGIENALLLLGSNDVAGNGLGNHYDLVGRFFMEHWYVDVPVASWGDALDLGFYDHTPQAVGPAHGWAQLALAEDLMRSERVAGLRLWFPSVEGSAAGQKSRRTLKAWLSRWGRPRQRLTELQLGLTDPGAMVRRLMSKLGYRSPQRTAPFLRIELEQTPHPGNRTRLLSRVACDAQPRADLVLRLREEERRNLLRSLGIAAAALSLPRRVVRQVGIKLAAGWSDFFWHHMGTTRMHHDPAQGVVDADCRVHGVSNLFVAGSSVFPTGGTAAPTLTIIALALRLAEHLCRVQGLPTATVHSPSSTGTGRGSQSGRREKALPAR
jgi:choline dehydrogenase-like flavoprotein